jgi:hypothetical protein
MFLMMSSAFEERNGAGVCTPLVARLGFFEVSFDPSTLKTKFGLLLKV